MKTASSIVCMAGILLLFPGSLCAYEPVVVLVGAATSGSASPQPILPAISAGAEFDWRFPAGETGYAAVWGSAEVESQLSEGLPLDDHETFGFEIGGFPKDLDLKAAASVAATSGVLDSPARLEPRWDVAALAPVGAGSVSLGVAYSGLLRWNETDNLERVENRFTFRAVSEPSFLAVHQYDLTAGLDFFPGTYLSDQNGDSTPEVRRDAVAIASLNMDVLSDYFTRWKGDVAMGVRFSNATRYLAATGALEEASENRAFGSIAVALALSPASSLSVDLSLTADAATYLGRAALDEAGSPLGENLAYLRSTAGLTASWSPFGRFFLIGNLSAAGAVANDPLYAGWSATAGLSAQWRL